jgi:hypothetical protein
MPTGVAMPGAYVGDCVGLTVGDVVGLAVGLAVGDWVGLEVGDAVGDAVVDCDGDDVGDCVGLAVGDVVGLAVGDMVGDVVGEDVGDSSVKMAATLFTAMAEQINENHKGPRIHVNIMSHVVIANTYPQLRRALSTTTHDNHLTNHNNHLTPPALDHHHNHQPSPRTTASRKEFRAEK